MIASLLLAAAVAPVTTAGKADREFEAPWAAWERGVGYLRDPSQAHKAVESFLLAAYGWERLRQHGEDPYTDRWLGYSYHAAGDLPHAIAAYRRGLAIDPADAKLRTAIEYARDQVQYPPTADLRPRPALWPPWLSLQYLGLYAFAAYFTACVALTRWRMTRGRSWLVAAGLLLAVAAVPVVGSVIAWQRERRDAAEPVAVINRDVPLRAGNGADYPAKLDLPRGCEVRRLFERGEWFQIETAGGAIGWVPANAVVHSTNDRFFWYGGS